MTIKITAIKIRPIQPYTKGKISRERAEKINKNIKRALILFRVGDSLRIVDDGFRVFGIKHLIQLGVYKIRRGCMPDTIDIAVTSEGHVVLRKSQDYQPGYKKLTRYVHIYPASIFEEMKKKLMENKYE